MQYRQPVPFYTTYPFLFPDMQEREQERDLQVMRSYYSHRAQRIQEKVERECDRMEYEGSMMYDEYPDKFMMEHLCRKIENEMMQEAESEDQENNMMTQEFQKSGGMRDLIGVLLFDEMFRRRCRHRNCRRMWW